MPVICVLPNNSSPDGIVSPSIPLCQLPGRLASVGAAAFDPLRASVPGDLVDERVLGGLEPGCAALFSCLIEVLKEFVEAGDCFTVRSLGFIKAAAEAFADLGVPPARKSSNA